MDRLIFTSGATVKEMANTRQILINELANVSTVGFKSSFGTALNSIKAEGSGGSFDTRIQVQTVTRDQIRLQAGSVMATGRELDVSLTNESVMQVQAPNGERAFTRRGDLRVNALGQLETGSGHLVMGQGGPINMPPGMMVSINSDGTVYAQDLSQGTTAPPIRVDQIALRDASQVVLSRRAVIDLPVAVLVETVADLGSTREDGGGRVVAVVVRRRVAGRRRTRRGGRGENCAAVSCDASHTLADCSHGGR